MRRVINFLLFTSLLLAMTVIVSGQGYCQTQEPPPGVLEAAQEGLSEFLEAIPEGEIERFNFSSQDELKQAQLADPIQVYTIDPEDILEFDKQTRVSELLKPTDIWLVPVCYHDKVRTFLKVDSIQGGWKAISIGSSKLAEEWSNINNAYPEAKGYNKIFVRVYQAKSDFVFLNPAQGQDAFVSLRSARIALGLEGGELRSPEQVITGMKDAVRQNLENEQFFLD